MNRSTCTPVVVAALAGSLLLAGCERPPMDVVQNGYRGTGMVQVSNPRLEAVTQALNAAPAAVPAVPEGGPLVRDVYQNVEVLNDLTVAEFTRLMVAMTSWVSPEQGCTYCHVGEDFASDDIYTKVVSRRMLEMTRHINSQWETHVAATGVTCFTCHRGKAVPQYVWYQDPGPPQAGGMSRGLAGQNIAAVKVGLTSLPYDPLTPYLGGDEEIRIETTTALPSGNDASILQTEGTYGFMMHMSDALGVNCTYCHNTRQFRSWEESSQLRTTGWHGIRMARDLNANYLSPLGSVLPQERLGPLGDAPKVSCTTCHQGVAKPLYGVSMTKDHPELIAARPLPPPAPPAADAASATGDAAADAPPGTEGT